MKNLLRHFIPRYDELTLFVMSLATILIVLSNAHFLRGAEFTMSNTDGRIIFLVLAFLAGLVLSIYHIFARPIKTEFEKFLMLFFAIVLNAISGIAAGSHALKTSQDVLVVFPVLNILNGILLVFLLRTQVIDESSIIESNIPFQLVCLSSLIAVILFVLCQYILKMYWASTLSICVAHATNLNRPVMSLFLRNGNE